MAGGQVEETEPAMKLFGRLPEMVFGLIIGIVMIQLAISAIAPYMDIIGKTFAVLIVAVLVAVTIAVTVVLIRFLLNRFGGGGGTFNG